MHHHPEGRGIPGRDDPVFDRSALELVTVRRLRTRRKEDAERVAGKVGGEMVLFNPIVRQMRVI